LATKYYCDICGVETHNWNELQQIARDYKNDTWLFCDLCKKCADKIFKPVKEWHTEVMLELKLTEEKK